MPCNTVQITTLDVSKMRHDLLIKSLESMGYAVTETSAGIHIQKGYQNATIRNGQVTTYYGVIASNLQANLQRAYSREVVSESAKRAGFVVQRKADYQLELSKRY